MGYTKVMDTSSSIIKIIKNMGGIAILLFFGGFQLLPLLADVPVVGPFVGKIFETLGKNDSLFLGIFVPVIVLLSTTIIIQGVEGLKSHHFMRLTGKRAEIWSMVWILLGVSLLTYIGLFFFT